jgi:BCD family chlorophyll transporter-like MFS transporter
MQLEVERLNAPLQTPAAGAARSAPVDAATDAESAWNNLPLARNVKLGLFHIGSSLADVLANGVWNRIMIRELGMAATPVALLLALRYFLAPLSVWVGHVSDTRSVFGYKRLPFVWGGRIAMVLSYPLLGASTLELAKADAGNSVAGWVGVVLSLVIFSIGSTFSGTTFLSLLYDRAPKSQRTRAVGVVWFFLVLGFAVAGIIYSRLLPEFTRDAFLALFISAPLVMAALWFFSVVGEERRSVPSAHAAAAEHTAARPFLTEFKAVWASRQARLFFLFLGMTTLFFYMQDVILEPFAATVFGMPLATTNRFSAYWGTLALAGIIISLILARRLPKRVHNMSLSRWSVLVLIVAFAIFFVSAAAQVRSLVTIGLVVMGAGLGMWTVGPLGLMMDMTRAWGAGLYLALWTVASTIARGLGVTLGGVLLDVALHLTGGQQATSYAVVFLIQVLGFVATWFVLRPISVQRFEQEAPQPEAIIAAAMD